MRFKNIELECKEGVGYIIFKRSEQLNAMNSQMMDEIIRAIGMIEVNNKVKVGVVTGEGKAFMAGADIKEYAKQSPEQFKDFQEKGKLLYGGLMNSKKPWIAMVNGYALGGGFEIVLACDLVLASEEAKLGLPEVFLGLIPGGGGTQRLANKIGLNRTKQMLFLGSSVKAHTLCKWGVVNEVFAEESFKMECKAFIEKLSRRSSAALLELKKLANSSVETGLIDQNIVEEGEAVLRLFLSNESRVSIREFVTKNKHK